MSKNRLLRESKNFKIRSNDPWRIIFKNFSPKFYKQILTKHHNSLCEREQIKNVVPTILKRSNSLIHKKILFIIITIPKFSQGNKSLMSGEPRREVSRIPAEAWVTPDKFLVIAKLAREYGIVSYWLFDSSMLREAWGAERDKEKLGNSGRDGGTGRSEMLPRKRKGASEKDAGALG